MIEPMLIYPDGHTEFVKPSKGKKFSLEELQGFVKEKSEQSSLIEFITLTSGAHLIINEEGKLNGSLPNKKATALAQKVLGGDIIMGTVLYCENKYVS